MMKNRVLFVFSLLLALPLASMAEEVAGERLDSTQIRQLFTNTTAACIKEKDRSSCATYMGESGAVKRLTHSNNKVRTGNWHVDDSGHLCLRWTGKDKDVCFGVSKMPNMTYQLYRKGKLKSTIIGFTPGDTIGGFAGGSSE